MADASGYPKLARILGPTAYNRDLVGPLVRPDIDVKDGDFLIAIDGHDLKGDNPYRYLQVTRGQKVKVTVNAHARRRRRADLRDRAAAVARATCATTAGSPTTSTTVLKASNGELGYMHITAMSTDNIGQFDKYWRAFRYQKGIVIDVRGNGGGWTEYFIIDKLERKMTAYNVLRDMVPFRYPGSVHHRPDRRPHQRVQRVGRRGVPRALQGAQARHRDRRAVVGRPGRHPQRPATIDNGTVQQSNNAFYGDDGQVARREPRRAIPTSCSRTTRRRRRPARTLQLEKAIEVLLKQIKEKPFTFPARPAYPKK